VWLHSSLFKTERERERGRERERRRLYKSTYKRGEKEKRDLNEIERETNREKKPVCLKQKVLKSEIKNIYEKYRKKR
jgi:hypothetical protein